MAWVLPVLSAVIAPLVFSMEGWRDLAQTTTSRGGNGLGLSSLLRTDFGLLLVLVGVVLAWIGSSGSVVLPDRAVRMLQPAIGWIAGGYRFSKTFSGPMNWPLRLAVQGCRLFDRFVLDEGMTALAARVVSWPSRAVAPLQNGVVQFYALSVVLATALLLIVLIWFQG